MRINILQYTRGGVVDKAAVAAQLDALRQREPLAHLTLAFPAGAYKVGSIHITSRTTILIDPLARLDPTEPDQPLFQSKDTDLISIVGQGRISFTPTVQTISPVPIILLRNCSRVHLEGLLLENTYKRAVTLVACRDVHLERMTLLATDETIHITGGSNIEGCNLSINSRDTLIHAATTKDHPLDRLTFRNTTLTGRAASILLQADGAPMTNVRLHQCVFSEDSQQLIATVLRGGSLDGLFLEECAFDGAQVNVAPADNSAIGLVSFLSPKGLTSAFLSNVSKLVVRGDRSWLKSAELKNVAFDEAKAI